MVRIGLFLTFIICSAAYAAETDCNAAPASPSLTVSVPGHPFGVLSSQDGYWIFVSLVGEQNYRDSGIAVLERGQGRLRLARVVKIQTQPLGMVKTHDEKLLIAANGDSVVFLDIAHMIAGGANPLLGALRQGPAAGSVNVNVTADDKTLFVSDEGASTITVIDLERIRSKGIDPEAVIGKISVGKAPIALIFSPDGKWLYTTSQLAAPEWNWPKACQSEGRASEEGELTRPEGAVLVINVEKARMNPSQSVTARVPSGCSPVRLAISPTGDVVYVTARNSNTVFAFDTGKLLTDPMQARLGLVPVGMAPVPVAVINGGKQVVAGNSNRFGRDETAVQTLSVLDAAKIRDGADALVGTIPAGAFPREMSVSPDGRTLFLTNFSSNSVQVMDIEHLPIERNTAR
jgi:DNA-binding beta-propeller fold protein YncE